MLRKRATDAERILWRHLRNRNFVGYKFRRRHPLGCYVLDFQLSGGKAGDRTKWWRAQLPVRPKARQKSVERTWRPGRDCVAVLEPSSSVRTRQRLESNLVCVGEKAFVAPSPQSSPFRRERRTLYGDDAISVAGPANAKKLLKQ
jgi:Protein of unknown function (DUF559)